MLLITHLNASMRILEPSNSNVAVEPLPKGRALFFSWLMSMFSSKKAKEENLVEKKLNANTILQKKISDNDKYYSEQKVVAAFQIVLLNEFKMESYQKMMTALFKYHLRTSVENKCNKNQSQIKFLNKAPLASVELDIASKNLVKKISCNDVIGMLSKQILQHAREQTWYRATELKFTNNDETERKFSIQLVEELGEKYLMSVLKNNFMKIGDMIAKKQEIDSIYKFVRNNSEDFNSNNLSSLEVLDSQMMVSKIESWDFNE